MQNDTRCAAWQARCRAPCPAARSGRRSTAVGPVDNTMNSAFLLFLLQPMCALADFRTVQYNASEQQVGSHIRQADNALHTPRVAVHHHQPPHAGH